MLRTRFSYESHPGVSPKYKLVVETTNLQTGEQMERQIIADNLSLTKAKELLKLARDGA